MTIEPYCDKCGAIVPTTSTHDVDPNYIVDTSGRRLVLCKSCRKKYEQMINDATCQFVGDDYFYHAAKEILAGLREMGFEIDDANFKDTPSRFARAYYEIFKGCINTQDKIDDILSTSFPANGKDDMVIAKDIVVFSMCPHHLLPVEYHVQVGYIPAEDGKVLGISKLGRLVDTLARRPMLQEEFTHEIVDQLQRIGIKGAIALVEGQHMCMRMRGARVRESTITTTSVTGVFRDDDGTKNEFMTNIANRKLFH